MVHIVKPLDAYVVVLGYFYTIKSNFPYHGFCLLLQASFLLKGNQSIAIYDFLLQLNIFSEDIYHMYVP